MTTDYRERLVGRIWKLSPGDKVRARFDDLGRTPGDGIIEISGRVYHQDGYLMLGGWFLARAEDHSQISGRVISAERVDG
jgi:hypothetical protein